jgi:hypothetical protein
MASADPKMSTQGTAGKRKHAALIIRRLQSGESHSEGTSSYNVGSPTVYDIKKLKEQLQQPMA